MGKKLLEIIKSFPEARIRKFIPDRSSLLESKGWEQVYHKGKFIGWLRPRDKNSLGEMITLYPLAIAESIQKVLDEPKENDIFYGEFGLTY